MPTLETAVPEAGMRRYALLLRSPGVGPVVLAGLLARVPLGMSALAMVLIVREAGQSYAAAGVVVAANTLASAASVPVMGRLVDRLGQRRVLLPLGLLFPAWMVVFTVLAAGGAGTGVLAVCAVAIGACMPPIGACMRALWSDLAPTDDLRETAYALEATLQEVFFVVGPLLTATLAALVSPEAAMLVAAACALIGTLALAATAASRAWHGGSAEGVGRLGALTAPGVRTILLASVGMGAAFGAIEVAMPAFAEAHGSRAAAGIPLAAFSLGSLLGGLWVGTRGGTTPPATRYLAALLALSLALVPLLVAGSIPVMTLLVLIAGMPIAPAFASAYGLINGLATPGTHTEAFAWLSTAILTGVSIGTAVGGDVIHRAGVTTALGVAAGCGTLAIVTATLRRATLTG